ncbi:hypothetical protein ACOI1H_23655 [Loktanella sp. DJP18]|uniref:hypothetical protein n=1 Tax=Loktanella sp. DJP18 TaxID=3409788 RepID=UPI003BB7068F
MFTIEHNHDETVVTLIDDVAAVREDDVRFLLSETGVVFMQVNEETGATHRVSLSLTQFDNMIAALNLPEGAYAAS